MPLHTTGTQFCVCTHSGLAFTDIEDLMVLEVRGKTSPISTGAYKWSIYIFQAWFRELIWKSLILHQPTLMAIACYLHIIMLGYPLCSHYITILMLCISLSPSGFTWAFQWWQGRVESTWWFWTFFSAITLHPWWHDRCTPWYSFEHYISYGW
jgi:hypothetical protein